MYHRRDNHRFLDVSLRCLLLLFFMVGPKSLGLAQQRMVQATTGVDTSLIRELNADGYGMKKYVMAFLKAGPNTNQDSITAARLQSAHLKNIQRMAKEGKLVIAGPFLDDTQLKGIYVFNVESVEEAKALTESDPAIKAGRLVMELHPWYGSAALQKVNEIHVRIQAKTF
jgi:uncharacterized protein YciI